MVRPLRINLILHDDAVDRLERKVLQIIGEFPEGPTRSARIRAEVEILFNAIRAED